ncbi:response regulator [Aestuariivirga litoralis]|uniref:response regulator n=1 Tax=Aestuariivirga litoralis TaxID=2650924 RepID=UPI0018C84B47|nr:response regulator [Aestuariivirga litoralis]MBG1233911.1 response regulator [Aestuariivirga litoralis]
MGYVTVSFSAETKHSGSDQGPAVLVVEDEALILWDIAEELRSAGFVVYEASHADAAIALLERHANIMAVFTDVNMPGSMDGMKLSHFVKDRWPPVKLVVTSGINRFKDLELPLGSVFLPKPYSPHKVISTLRALLT